MYPTNLANPTTPSTPPQERRHLTPLEIAIAVVVVLILAFCAYSFIAGAIKSPSTTPPAVATQNATHISALVHSVSTYAKSTDVSVSDGDITVTLTFDSGPSYNATVLLVKDQTFQMMKTLRTTPHLRLTSVEVDVVGPVRNVTGTISNGYYGKAFLTSDTAARFDWAHMLPENAWKMYDSTFLISQ
jgi:FlaG/FlaF family flagellin (archaellin)